MNSKFYHNESFLCIDGPARKSKKEYSNLKVCFTCCDLDFLKKLMAKLAQDNECYFVKVSTTAKNGMYLGRSFFTTKEYAGEVWAKYKAHPRLMVTLQDDDFTNSFRDKVISWKDKPENEFE